jgi:hypothetical protein
MRSAVEAGARMVRQVEQRVDLGDTHAFGAVGDLADLVACLHQPSVMTHK